MESKSLFLCLEKLLIIRPNPIINAVCPGFIKTNIGHTYAERGIVYKLLLAIFNALKAAPSDVGARSLVLAATTKEEEHGTFRRPYMTDDEYAKYVTSFLN